MTATAPRLSLLLAITMMLGGCHTFQRASYDQVAPGTKVRARVTGAWADSLQSVLLKDARVLEGTVVDKPTGAVLMEVTVQNELRGIQFESLRQRVSIPREAFVDLEIKELDRGRTFAVAAVGVGVVGALIIQQLSKDTGGSTLPGDGGGVESRILRPLFRIPLP